MAHTAGAQAIPRFREAKRTSFGVKHSTFIVTAVILMLVFVVYVGSHIRMTELEYKVAAQLSDREKKLEEQKRLRLELATLRSPQRIESVARNKLQMSYPESGQIIVLKYSGE
ncbi:MAG TPA: cell division protein FtsL [Smithellaceae bacterium]|nr:cell division protein FtsL [Smithellaceae bacterium]HRS89586.1 cell division protein FtsL [Smithellaceae bacterium]HRV26353.1 cell division protein FtsL [Smithellaceae bacterium]